MKDKIYKIKIFFRNYFTIYTGFEDWKEQVWDCDLDEWNCCAGYDCCCGGRTLRDNLRDYKK